MLIKKIYNTLNIVKRKYLDLNWSIISNNKYSNTNLDNYDNLQIINKPEWQNHTFGEDNYEVSISLIGSNIILSKIKGYNTLKTAKERSLLIEKIAKENISESSYILLEDYTDFKSATKAAKDYYIQYQENNKNVKLIIFINPSPYMKMMLKLGKRLSKVKFPVEIVNNYRTAISLSQNIGTNSFSNMQNVINKKYQNLSIICKPEWQNLTYGSQNYKVTLSLIDSNIIMIQSTGFSDINTIMPLIDLVIKITNQYIPQNKQLIILEDYQYFTGTTSEAKNYYINYFVKYKRLKAAVFFNTSTYFKIIIKLGKQLGQVKIPVEIANDYNSAINLAKKLDSLNLTKNSKQNNQQVPVTNKKLFTKDDWVLELDNYGVKFSTISDDILFNTTHGILQKHHVDKFFLLYDLVIHESGIVSKGYYYRIIDWTNFDRSHWNARRLYSNKIEEYNKKIPCKLMIMYGLNPIMKMVIKIGAKLSLIPIVIVNDLNEAIEEVNNDKNKITKYQKQIIKKYSTKKIDDEVNKLLNFMGEVNWDYAGMEQRDISNFSLFSPLYESLILIKEDFDNILVKKDEVEEEIVSRNKLIEIKSAIWQIASDKTQSTSEFLTKVFEKIATNLQYLKIAYYKDFLIDNEHFLKCTNEWKLDGIPSTLGENVNPELVNYFTRKIGLVDLNDIVSNPMASPKIKKIITDIYKKTHTGSLLIVPLFHNIHEKSSIIFSSKIKNNAFSKQTKNLLEEISFIIVNYFSYKKNQVSLQRNEEKFRVLYDNSQEAFLLLSPQKGFLGANKSTLKLFGYKNESELISLLPSMISPKYQPDGSPSLAKSIEMIKIAMDKGSHFFEWTHKKKSGEEFLCTISLSKMTLNDGVILQAGLRDITKDRLAEQTIKKMVDELKQSNDIYLQEIEQRKKIEKELEKTHEELENRVKKRTEDLNQSNENLRQEIIERVSVESKLVKAKEVAEIASEAKTNFLANMSHEIRTPLNGIIGMAELARDTDLDDTQKKLMNTINFEADSLLAVINDILDFSKIEAGKIILENVSFNLKSLLDDYTESFAYKAEQKGLEFLLYYSDDIPNYLYGDPGKIKQVLTNLTSNALKFTNQGEIFIKVEVKSKNYNNIDIKFSVKDTGIGIPKDKQDSIFDSFTQADGSTTRKYGGTGLGTTISKKFVEMMQGKIFIESEVGKGSTFYFTSNFKIDHSKNKGTMEISKLLENMLVLVVDDNKTNLFILQEYLKTMNCTPILAESGKQALEILNENQNKDGKIKLIITDYQMPEMDGYKLTNLIRKIDQYINIPILILSSIGKTKEVSDFNKIQINGYLTKPIRRNALKMKMLSIFNIKNSNIDKDSNEVLGNFDNSYKKRTDKKILLAEDYPTNQQIAIKHLSNAGYKVQLAENGKQAWNLFQNNQFSLIFMDIQMPEMDGYDATLLIRKHEEENNFHKTPIIAMTAHAFKGYKEKCLAIGMDDYITKPLRKKELIRIADKWAFEQKIIENITPKTKFKIPEIIQVSDRLPSLNIQEALEEFDNDKEFLSELLNEFVIYVENQIIILRQAIVDNDFEIIKKEAHSIKGGAANIMAKQLSKIAKDLEEIGKVEDLTYAEEILDKLEEEYISIKKIAQNI